MILRTYRTRVDPNRLAEYEAFESEEGLPMIRSMAGCIAAGYGRVAEEREPTYVFFSVWNSREELDRARATPTWKRVAGKLETMGLSLGGDQSEHVEVRAAAGLAEAGKR